MDEINAVDMALEGIGQDDAAQAPETQGMSLEEAVADTQQDTQEAPKSEPGWIKKRVETAVEKRLAEVESRIRNEYEARMAPMRDAMFEREADKLVADGEFKTRERALEYVRLKGGAPQPEAAPAAPRDDKGRFAPRQDDGVEARAQMLYAQAESIRETSGVDVMEIYNTDPEVKRKVATGEWTFIDVYKSLPESKGRVPSPTRSANNGSLADVNILKMSQGQRAKLNETLAKGGVINFMK